MTEGEMVGWHHRLDGHEFEEAPGDGEGQGGLACYSSWNRKQSDMTEHVCRARNRSVHFSRSVVSDSLQPHGLQHARLPCPSPTPEVYSDSCHWLGDTIQPSHPLSSPSPPAFNLSQHEGHFQ